MKFASIIPASLPALLFLGGFASPSVGQESRLGSPKEETVKFIIAAEAKWANSACSPQPDLKDVIADDFQGTSPSGRRYGKKEIQHTSISFSLLTDTQSNAFTGLLHQPFRGAARQIRSTLNSELMFDSLLVRLDCLHAQVQLLCDA